MIILCLLGRGCVTLSGFGLAVAGFVIVFLAAVVLWRLGGRDLRDPSVDRPELEHDPRGL